MWSFSRAQPPAPDDGTALVQRDDDQPETVLSRLKVYYQKTEPLIEYYQAKGLLIAVDGTQYYKTLGEDIARRAEGGAMIYLKSPAQIAVMRKAGALLYEVLQELRQAVRPGVSTMALDELAEKRIRDFGATPSFLGYRGFPATLCTSINEQVVHGIPSPDVVLTEGDILSVDCGLILDGWQSDSAFTVGVGDDLPGEAEADRRDGAVLLRRCAAGRTAATACRTSATRSRPWPKATATASSASWWATASGATCTRSPAFPTSAKRATAYGCARA